MSDYKSLVAQFAAVNHELSHGAWFMVREYNGKTIDTILLDADYTLDDLKTIVAAWETLNEELAKL